MGIGCSVLSIDSTGASGQSARCQGLTTRAGTFMFLHSKSVLMKRTVLLVLLSTAFAGGKVTAQCLSGNNQAEAGDRQSINVYLLAGQSNMDGRGLNTELPSIYQSHRPDIQIHFEGKWYDLQPGLSYSHLWSKFGPELTFGRLLADNVSGTNKKIALVKYARGGTNLAVNWDPASGPLYAAFITQVHQALNSLPKCYKPVIKGMIWMQGESDALNGSYALKYRENLEKFIESVRAEFADANIPFVIGQISESPVYGKNGKIVRQAQLKISQDMARAALVVTSDLKLQDDYHYDSKGVLELGSRFANTMIALENRYVNGYRADNTNHNAVVDFTDFAFSGN